ncbi:hypothetical protein HDV57DRAFT_425649 [Trichoderma longibrachiatum]|uniref:Uncharacterized protein n=1 Tax=Trichoderma longibrachiatum ATCC 18648 TaxID=983965 RepID=A0A2T4CFA4_TRILO|nr:hypothetical protein M440DRAFT_187354 [Trichoderma longibrachiatum ATCC 18648]
MRLWRGEMGPGSPSITNLGPSIGAFGRHWLSAAPLKPKSWCRSQRRNEDKRAQAVGADARSLSLLSLNSSFPSPSAISGSVKALRSLGFVPFASSPRYRRPFSRDSPLPAWLLRRLTLPTSPRSLLSRSLVTAVTSDRTGCASDPRLCCLFFSAFLSQSESRQEQPQTPASSYHLDHLSPRLGWTKSKRKRQTITTNHNHHFNCQKEKKEQEKKKESARAATNHSNTQFDHLRSNWSRLRCRRPASPPPCLPT